MKGRAIIPAIVAASVAAMLSLAGCTKDETPSAMLLVSLVTDGGVVLNAPTPAVDVPLNASVVATFTKAVMPTTATNLGISLSVDGIKVPSDVTVTGTIVTINPTNDLTTASNYTVTITSSLKATDGGAAVAGVFTFKTL